MEKLLDRFNIFDIFTVLLPGIVTLSLIGATYTKYNPQFCHKLENEEIFLFFVAAYLLGILLNEIGVLLDRVVHRIIYRGPIKEKYLQAPHNSVLRYEELRQEAELLRSWLSKQNKEAEQRLGLSGVDEITEEAELERKELIGDAYLFSKCMTICENKGLAGKAEKMLSISEMSRSLSLGCVITLFISILTVNQATAFFWWEILVLLFAAIVLYNRKVQFERYRVRIIIKVAHNSIFLGATEP